MAKSESENMNLTKENVQRIIGNHGCDISDRKEALVNEVREGFKNGWVEGFPNEPGDYWWYWTTPGKPSLSRVVQGFSNFDGTGKLTHIADDILYPSKFHAPLHLIWHKRLNLPSPPEFDRTCPTCNGTGMQSWGGACFDCDGTGKL